MTDHVLLDALDRLHDTGPEFDDFLANHGPMAAEALIRLGGSDAVPAWVDHYLPRLGPAPTVVKGLSNTNWREHLGEVRLTGDWTGYLRQQARDLPWHDLLQRWWPRLLPGMAASATHGVIRTAHAVRSLRSAGDQPDPLLVDELVHGLALWAARYQTLPGNPGLEGRLDAVTAAGRLPRLDPAVPSEGPGIGGRLQSLHHLPHLADGLDAWNAPSTPDQALDELVRAASRVLAARSDAPIAFCHAVTAPAAVRLVLPVLPARMQAASVAASWQVVGGIVAAFASPRLATETAPTVADPAPSIDELAAHAIEHGDEHVIKLTEAALREFRRHEDPTLLIAAARFRERTPAA